eukprot:3616562-Rhodomonas_salina.2
MSYAICLRTSSAISGTDASDAGMSYVICLRTRLVLTPPARAMRVPGGRPRVPPASRAVQ